jgi:predicted nucleic acid binding AN1-type Zn finger protein
MQHYMAPKPKSKKTKKVVCALEQCSGVLAPLHRIVGKCSRCAGEFCMEHRLPEAHGCTTSVPVSQDEKDKLAQSMRCAPSKV